jgi:hypothetical protein
MSLDVSATASTSRERPFWSQIVWLRTSYSGLSTAGQEDR